MGLFGKKKGKSSETIDFTKLEKRGIVKPIKNEDTLDLTNNSPETNSSDTSSAFGFLSNLANSSSTEEESGEENSISGYDNLSGDKKARLKTFLRNLREKTRENTDKIQDILDRLEVLERRTRANREEY